ncbi:MAG TPA: hypothetical protein VN844_21860 [Pyrinomonadaceae bacterium]|nr:hypothetical protein [Pyrinomonadaceae bacterium]
MKTLRQVCAATILSLTFAASAFAGDIYCPGVVSTSGTGAGSATTTMILTIVNVIYS